MESSISISEIIGTIYDGDVEICASADSAYDRGTQKVIVTLKAFARAVSTRGHGEPVHETWLPPSEQVTEHLEREEADAFAKDVFCSWVKKVRASVPDELRLHT